MLILKLIIIVLGITFSTFGYLIVFKKKFGLINDFEARKKVGSQTDADAIRVGKVALTLGAGLLVLFVLLMIFTQRNTVESEFGSEGISINIRRYAVEENNDYA